MLCDVDDSVTADMSVYEGANLQRKAEKPRSLILQSSGNIVSEAALGSC